MRIEYIFLNTTNTYFYTLNKLIWLWNILFSLKTTENSQTRTSYFLEKIAKSIDEFCEIFRALTETKDSSKYQLVLKISVTWKRLRFGMEVRFFSSRREFQTVRWIIFSFRVWFFWKVECSPDFVGKNNIWIL